MRKDLYYMSIDSKDHYKFIFKRRDYKSILRGRSNLSVRYNFNLEKSKLVSLSELVKKIKNNVTDNISIIELKMRNGMLIPYTSGNQLEYFTDEVSNVTLSEISKVYNN